MNDDALDDRLRSGLRSLAEAAGEPPRFDAITMRRPTPNAERRSPWFAAIAVAGVVALIAGALVAVAELRGGTSDGASGPLFAAPWYLESIRADGTDVGTAPVVEWVFVADVSCDEQPAGSCEQGPAVEGTDACNHFTRTIQNVDGAVRWGTFWMSTLVACLGPVPDTFDRFMRADGFTYRFDGDRLVLVADGVELVFTSVGPPPALPPPTAPESTVPATTAPIAAPADPVHPFLPPTSIAPLTDVALAPTGVATRFLDATSSGGAAQLDGVTLDGCRELRPGVITVDARWAGDQVAGASLSLILWRADMGTGSSGLVDLSGPGEFSVTFDLNTIPLWPGDVSNIENALDDVSIGRDGLDRFRGSACGLGSAPDRVPITVDPVRSEVTAPEGSVAWFAQTLDLADPNADLRPLAYFAAYRGWPAFGRIHIAPGFAMTSMTVDVRPFPAIEQFGDPTADDPLGPWGRCAEIRSTYDVDGATVVVTELYGCEPRPQWVDDPATVGGDDTTGRVGVLANREPGEFVAVVGQSGPTEELAAAIVRAPID